jgi:hypothetical protein
VGEITTIAAGSLMKTERQDNGNWLGFTGSQEGLFRQGIHVELWIIVAPCFTHNFVIIEAT